MKITVLDGYTLNPGDLDWGAMAAFGDLTVYDRTPADKTVERAIGSEIVITNKTVLDADAISRLPELKYIGVLATGYNIVDVGKPRHRGHQHPFLQHDVCGADGDFAPAGYCATRGALCL